MLPVEDCRELAATLASVENHLARYELGSAKDAQGELAAVRLLIERVKGRLEVAGADDPR